MKIYSSDVFFGHELAGHAESPQRLTPLLKTMQDLPVVCSSLWLRDTLVDSSADQFFHQFIKSSHEAVVLGRIVELLESGGHIDADTYVRPDSLSVALEAIACSFGAADAVIKGHSRETMAIVRPPGHHATRDRSMGFCLFNSIAVLAKRLQAECDVGKILIVDFDVHHGNGSQDIFYDDDSVFFFSLHRFPFYPGTGTLSETGTGKGLGYTLNTPLDERTEPEQFLASFQRGLEQAAAKIQPEIILVSAGFDAHREDPVGGLGLASADYQKVAVALKDVAAQHCDGRIVSLLEGGYNPVRLAESISYYIKGFSH